MIVWKNRKAFLRRGYLMIDAHWRNRCTSDDLSRWFEHHYGRYCTFRSTGKDNRYAIEKRFWNDAIKWQEKAQEV